MRRITADIIFSISSKPFSNKVLILEDDGTVLDIVDANNFSSGEIEKLRGALVPGFINTHCHIELSHLRNKFDEKTGLGEFLMNVTKHRDEKGEVMLQAIEDAENEMIENGIVAVGDISNLPLSFKQKAKRNLYYHTFIELLSFNPENSYRSFENGKELMNNAKSFGLQVSLAPHAPYTVSPLLLELISKQCYEDGKPTSFHMLESNDENEFYLQGSGNYRKLYRELNVPIKFFEPTGKTSLESTLPFINKEIKTLLVHNTIATVWDMEWAEDIHPNLFWCLCPNANLFIEDRLPEIPLLMNHVQYLTVGTDSLSSNHQLSILEELKSIQNKFPEIKLEDMLRWATLYGAIFLGIDAQFGSFEKGKKPGVNLIEGFTIGNEDLKHTKVRKII